MSTYYLTKEALEELKNELVELRAKKKVISERIKDAKGYGDLSENSEYQEAKDAWAFNEGRILDLEDIVRGAKIVEKPKKFDSVGIGATVKVRSALHEEVFVLVDSQEVDPGTNKISFESPLGKAFMDKKVGDVVEVKTLKGVTKYKILRIY